MTDDERIQQATEELEGGDHPQSGVLPEMDLNTLTIEQRYYALIFHVVQLLKELRPERSSTPGVINAEGGLDFYRYSKHAFFTSAATMEWIVKSLPRGDVIQAIDHSEWDVGCTCVEEFREAFKVDLFDDLANLKAEFKARAENEIVEGMGARAAMERAAILEREFNVRLSAILARLNESEVDMGVNPMEA